MAKILIVDDDGSIRFVLQHLLSANGYETAEAANGVAALDLFQTRFFDLIIADLRMPMMDGMSFLREVKKQESAVPVIVLTAYDSTETAIESMKNGAFRYMTKPFKADDLLNTIKSALASRIQVGT